MNNNEYRYQLDSPKVTGRRQQKISCPQCGRKRCFVRYVDTQNGCQYLHDTVGRCDHEQRCGYHYKPSEFFHDQPWRKDDVAGRKIPSGPPVVAKPLMPLNPAYLLQSHSPKSTFWQWFTTDCARKAGFSEEDAARMFHDYGIGATRRGDVIFWQVDELGRIRSGHIMQYDRQGHRTGYQGWVHARLIEQQLLPPDFTLHQCFFGQHLLPMRPDATVCLVESEKTALILAAAQPDHLWLATCGSSGLSASKCACLQGRRVVLFPDSGCLDKWQKRMDETCGIDYSFCKDLEQYPPNTDLADLLLEE
ncbi:MAG: hypothetical protein IJP46_03560 [Prevotella sp.]|nr:hypothetical protein [Prevotella sp.]